MMEDDMTQQPFEKAVEHVGESRAAENHDHDMIDELSRRLDMIWRYDQYIANAEGHEELQDFWRKVKQQESENVDELKRLIGKHVEQGDF